MERRLFRWALSTLNIFFGQIIRLKNISESINTTNAVKRSSSVLYISWAEAWQLAAAAVCAPAIQNGHKLEELFTILPMHINYTGWNEVIRYLKETKGNLIEGWKCSIILFQSAAFLDWFTIEPWVLFIISLASCLFLALKVAVGNYSDLFWGKHFELPDDFKIHTSDVILIFGNGLIQNWWIKPGFSETKTMYSIEVYCK